MKVLAIKCIYTIEDFEKPPKTFKETDNVVYLGIGKGD